MKLCRNFLFRSFVALAIISSLLVPRGYCQETEDSQVFIAGFNAYQQKDYTSAIDKMSEVLQKFPDTPLRDMALFWLARSYFKTGNQQDAARYLSQFSKEYPDNPLKSTVEEELTGLVARYEKGEKLAGGTPVAKAGEKQASLKAKADKERLAKEKAEQDRIAREKADAERLAKAKAEEERVAAEQAAKDKAEQQRIAALKAEEDRKAAEKAEQDRIALAKAEEARKASLAAEAARLAATAQQQEQLAAAKIEAARLAAEKVALEKAVAEKTEQQRLAALKQEEDRKAAVLAEQQRQERDRTEQARIAALRQEEQRLAAEKAVQERLAIEKAEQERLAQVKAEEAGKAAAAAAMAEQQRLALLKQEEGRKAAEKAEVERLAKAKAEQEQLAAAKADQQRLANEQAEQQRLAALKQEEDRKAAAKVEVERLAKAKAEQERLETEKAEQQRIAALKAEEARKAAEAASVARIAAQMKEQERLAAEKAEQERLAAAKVEQERLAKEQAEQQRLAAAKVEQDRIAAEKAETERLAKAKAEQERIATAKLEQERLTADTREKERIAAATAAEEAAAKEKAEQQRLAALGAEEARKSAEKAELERQTAFRAEEERKAAATAETARLAAVQKEKDRLIAEKAAAEAEATRIAAAKAEEQRLAKLHEAEEKARAEKQAMREKAIAQYKTIIEQYPGSAASVTAAAKLRELGIAVAVPAQVAAVEPVPENAQILRLEVAQFAGFEFNLLSRPDAYVVGKRISVPFEITNRGNGSDSFVFESGFPSAFGAKFASAAAPEQILSQTPSLAPGDIFRGVVNLTIPASSIDGLRIIHPVKAASRFMAEASQSREIVMTASAPLLRALVRTDKAQPLPGEKVVYRIAVLNVGSTAAQDVTFRLNYPPQLEPVDFAAAGFRLEAGSVLSFDGLQVSSGESKEFSVTFQLKNDSMAGQELATRAELINNTLKTSAAFVSNVTYVKATYGIQVRPLAERKVIIPGQTVTVPFVVQNTGNSREKFKITSNVQGAQEAVLFLDLNRDGIRQASEPLVTEIGPLSPKEEVNVVMEIKTQRTAIDGSEGAAHVSFVSEGDAKQVANASAQLVYSRPVLKLAMAGQEGRLKPGEVAWFDLTVANNGSNIARIVELQTFWPEQLELVAADPVIATNSNGKIIWNFKELGAGERRSIKVSFRVKPGTVVGTNIQVKNIMTYEDQLGNRY